MVRLLVGNYITQVDGHIGNAYDALRRQLGYEQEGAAYIARQYPGADGIKSTLHWKKCTCPVKAKGVHFPTGVLAKARHVLDLFKISYQLVDTRPAVPLTTDVSMTPLKKLRDYQLPIVQAAVERGRGIVKLATGGGKTVIAAALIAALGVVPFIFFVPSQDLLRQAHSEFESMLLHTGQPAKVGRVGAGFRDIQPITVMTVQSAMRALDPERFVTKAKDGKVRKKKVKLYEDDDEDFGDDETELGEYRLAVRDLILSAKGCICDEVQHWRSDTAQTISGYMSNCRYRYGFSATPWRDAGDDILIDACFGKSLCDINASFLIDHPERFLVPPEIFWVPVDNMKGTKFADYHEGYDLGIVNNVLRNNWIANISHSLSDQGRMILILIKHIAHGEQLQELIPDSVFLNGNNTPVQRERHLELMREHKAPVTIASTIFDEGIDVRPLDGLILAGGGKSQTRALQRIGRVIRPYSNGDYEKKNAVVVDFFDDMKWMRGHSNARRRIYNTESRFAQQKLVLT